MQEPNTIHLPSQVTASPACIFGVRGGFLACQLRGVVDQQASTRVGRVEASKGTQGISDRALFLTTILLKVPQFAETVNNNHTGLHKSNQGLEVKE